MAVLWAPRAIKCGVWTSRGSEGHRTLSIAKGEENRDCVFCRKYRILVAKEQILFFGSSVSLGDASVALW